MDSPEEFAQFWIDLGRHAGFAVQSDRRSEVFNRRGTSALSELDDEQHKAIAALNQCSQRVADLLRSKNLARRRSTTFASDVETNIDRLLHGWSGREQVRAYLGNEPEPEAARVLAAEEEQSKRVVTKLQATPVDTSM